MSDLIDRQKVLNTLDFADNALDEERTVEKYKELLTECIKVLPSAENKGDLISRQAVLEAIEDDNRNGHYSCFASNNDAQCFKDVIRELPSVENKGKWKKTYLDHVAMGERPSILYCSVCCQCIAYPTNFCPNCGADMRGEADEQT